jgi:hypothetical protein
MNCGIRQDVSLGKRLSQMVHSIQIVTKVSIVEITLVGIEPVVAFTKATTLNSLQIENQSVYSRVKSLSERLFDEPKHVFGKDIS